MTRILMMVFMLVFTGVALAGSPPDNILVLLRKMKGGAPLSSDEQATLRAWQEQAAYNAGGGQGAPSGPPGLSAMPPDIAAIISKAQRGIPPNADEAQKLKAYGERMNGHEGEIKKKLEEQRAVLEQAKPDSPTRRSTVKNPFLEGVLTIRETQVTSGPAICDDHKVSITTTVYTAIDAPVRIKTREPGKELSAIAQAPAQGPFSALIEPLNGAPVPMSVRTDTAGCHGGSASTSSIALMRGELNVDSRRTFLDLPVPGIYDRLQPKVVWQGTQGLNAEMIAAFPQLAGAAAQIPGLIREASDRAMFVFPGETLRDAIRSGGSAPVVMTGVYTSTLKTDEGGRVLTTINLSLVLRPEGGKLHMAVLDSAGKESAERWRKWLPMPWLESDQEATPFGLTKHDPSVVMKVGLRLDDNKTCKLHVSLDEVSDQKGITTNYPVKATDSRKTLRLLSAADQDDAWVVDREGQFADSKNEVSSIGLKVVSLETGAWGTLKARCEALHLDATFEPDGDKPTLQLPRDDNHNHVADQWEEDNGSRSRNLAATWDEDEQPEGQRRTGDGYTFYEEYRGFLVRNSADDYNRKFVRTNWNKKDGFVIDGDKLFSQFYMPSNAAHFDWHFVDTGLVKFNGDQNDPENRWVNSNTASELTYAKQYCIDVVLDAKYPEGAVAESRTGQDPLNTTFWHPMQSFFRVVVNPNSGNFINRKNLPNCSDAQIAQMRHDDTYGAVIHEVGHHLGVHHHFIAKVDEAKPPRNPDGTVKWPEFDSEIYNGVVDCVMRYNAKRSDGRIMEQCTRITSFRYCTKSDTAYYPVNDDRNGKLIAYPSDDCWGQIDVKSDP